MRDIAVTISASGRLQLSNRVLGYQGEENGTRLVINVEEWDAPGCTYGMTIMRDDGRGWTAFEGAIPDDGVVAYVVNSYALEIEGRVRVQFAKNDGAHVLRSEQAVMDALLSVLPADPPADDMPAWYELMMDAAHELGLTIQGAGALYDDMLAAKQDAEDAEEAADTFRDEAEIFRNDAESFAQAAHGSEQGAAGSATLAETARGEAAEAAEEAERYYASLIGVELVVDVVNGMLNLYSAGDYSPIDIEMNGRALEVWKV